MKTTIKSTLILLVMFLFSSCLKENHSIRMKNNFSEQLNNVRMGTAEIGSVPAGATSEYKSINTGDFTISGTTASGQNLSGSGTLSGKGKHKWTLTVDGSGQVKIVEDK